MNAQAQVQSKTQWLLTPPARLNYANLMKARVSRFDSSKSGYSCLLVWEPTIAVSIPAPGFPIGQAVDITPLKMLAWQTGLDAWGEAKARDAAVIWPFKYLSPDHKTIPGFPNGSVAANLQSNYPPGLADQLNQTVIDPNIIYSGCYVWCMCNAYAWERAGRRGVSLGLGNMQKLADGSRLDNRRTIEQDFAPLPGAAGPGPGGGGSGSPAIPF